MSATSYTAETHPDLDFELARLRNQATLQWDKEARNLAWLGLRPDMDVLEIGCGPGFVTEQLLALVPDGTLTAIEPDDELLGRARAYLAGRDVTLLQATISDTGLADASVEFVLVRFVLQHLASAEPALREIQRVLRPGGRVVVTDIDDGLWGMSYPEIPALASVLERRGGLQAALGGDRKVGRKLPGAMRAAGLAPVGIETLALTSDELGLEALMPQIDPARLALMVEKGVISQAELDGLVAERDRFLAAEHPSLLLLMLMVCGEKPA